MDATAEPLTIIACGALAREILAVCKANRLDHVELRCLPAILHNHPERIVPRVREAIRDVRVRREGRILIAYGDCGTGGALEALVQGEEGVEMLPGAHCYAFFEGVDRFHERAEVDAFYLTDFLANHFESFVVAPLKLREHPELREMMFANYRSVVHLEQVEAASTRASAATAAAFLELPLERRQTGYGDLEVALVRGAA